jgi:iron complex outermembrane recepter protein
MYRTFIVSLIIFLGIQSPLLPQSYTGQVVDDESNRPVIGAHVFLVRNNVGDVTDRSGVFEFTGLKIRYDTLRVTHLGYASFERGLDLKALQEPEIIRLKAVPLLLGDVVVTATRLDREVRSVAGAVDVVLASSMTGTRRHYMEDALRFIPGIFVQSRPNQDEARITVRGSGIRTNWGVRGMRVLMNGIPLTDADGLTDIDAIDLAIIDRIEVLRGPASSLYGTGSLGGVLHFITITPPQSFAADAYTAIGGFGFRRFGVSLGGTGTSHSYLMSASYHDKDGYRKQSGGISRRAYGVFTYLPDELSELQLLAFWRSIRFDLPGSLTFAEFNEDPRNANPTAVVNRWRKEKSRSRLGVRYRRRLTPGISVSVLGYYGDHATPHHPIFMLLEEDFRTAGGDIQVQTETENLHHRLIFGTSRETIGGGARYYVNNEGVRGALMRNERITVTGSGLYGQYNMRVSDRLQFAIGIRFDRHGTQFDDLIDRDYFYSETDGWSGSFGGSFLMANPLSVYFAGGFGFEPAAITEVRGSDFMLDPVRAINVEGGIRFEPSGVFSASAALYEMRMFNDIIPYTEEFQTKYRNADRTRHRGMEVTATLKMNGGFLLNAAYTLSNFKFVRDEAFTGNTVPGIPPHRVAARVQYGRHTGLFLGLGGEWNNSFHLNDANTDMHSSYGILSFFAGWEYRSITIESSIENLLDERYASYVRVNESNRRYFEPGDGRSLHVRVQVRY